MAILNSAEVRPSAIAVILRAIASIGESGVEKDLLITILNPKGYNEPLSNVENEIRENISVITDLKLVTEVDGKFILNPAYFSYSGFTELDITKALRRATSNEESNGGDWKAPSRASEFTNSVAWFLTLPTSGVSATFESGSPNIQDLQSRQFGDREKDGWVIGNKNRWNAFKYWACSLGFAYFSSENRIVPDPTIAIREDISDIFSDSSKLPATEFIKRISKLIPVLDGGRYRLLVEEHIKTPPQIRPGIISASLSMAIKNLNSQKTITIHDSSDAERITLFDNRTVSHLEINESQVR